MSTYLVSQEQSRNEVVWQTLILDYIGGAHPCPSRVREDRLLIGGTKGVMSAVSGDLTNSFGLQTQCSEVSKR